MGTDSREIPLGEVGTPPVLELGTELLRIACCGGGERAFQYSALTGMDELMFILGRYCRCDCGGEFK